MTALWKKPYLLCKISKKNETRKGCFEQKLNNNSNNIKAFYFDFDGTKKNKLIDNTVDKNVILLFFYTVWSLLLLANYGKKKLLTPNH